MELIFDHVPLSRGDMGEMGQLNSCHHEIEKGFHSEVMGVIALSPGCCIERDILLGIFVRHGNPHAGKPAYLANRSTTYAGYQSGTWCGPAFQNVWPWR